MGVRKARSFPFVDLSEEEMVMDGWAEALAQDGVDIIDAYGKDGGAEIDQMLGCDGIVRECQAMAYGVASVLWTTFKEAGLARRSPLSDKILERLLVWMGVAMRQAFIAGAACGKKSNELDDLEAVIEDAGIRWLGGADDVG